VSHAYSAGNGREIATDFADLIARIEASPVVQPKLAAAALSEVRNGVITGEGPTTAGRIHFSRCIDAADTATVRRILVAGGSQPVTRAEADALFDIHEAAIERVDGGAFDDLFAPRRWPPIRRSPTGPRWTRLPSTARSRPGSTTVCVANVATMVRLPCSPC
jgi:hypothetical protein